MLPTHDKCNVPTIKSEIASVRCAAINNSTFCFSSYCIYIFIFLHLFLYFFVNCVHFYTIYFCRRQNG